MGKFKKISESDPYYSNIMDMAEELGLIHYTDIYPMYLKKRPSNSIVDVAFGNDISEGVSGKDKNNTLIVAVFPDALDKLDDKSVDFILRAGMSKVQYDFDKDKLIIDKHGLLTVYQPLCEKYGSKFCCDMAELEMHTLDILQQEEKERKAAEKEAKKAKKKKD